MFLSWVAFLGVVIVFSLAQDPYKILGVSRNAKTAQIRQAYKKLAKEWHPDRNKHPDAESRFIEISKAYEVLSDTEKRQRYDNYGDTEERPQSRGGGGHHGNFHFDFGGFPFGGGHSHSFGKDAINFRLFETTLVAQSFEKPFIMFVYTDWCMSCVQLEPVWDRIVSDLRSVGYGAFTVNGNSDRRLNAKLFVRNLPTVAVLVEGRVIHYNEYRLELKTVLKFSKSVIPTHITAVDDSNVAEFLSSAIQSNRVAVLMVGNTETARLRYLLLAFKYKVFGSFGYVHLRSGNTQHLLRQYDVRQTNSETLLLFNEKVDRPVAMMSSPELSTESIRDMMESNKYLILPRISTQSHFDDLCPPENSRARKRLCAILMVTGSSSDELHLSSLRNFVESEGSRYQGRVRFAYMFSHTQAEFLRVLEVAQKPADRSVARDLLIIWRFDRLRSRYLWLDGGWNGHPTEFNQSAMNLQDKIGAYLKGSSLADRETILKEIYNEFAPGWFIRVKGKLRDYYDNCWYYITNDEFTAVASLVGTLFFIFMLGVCLNAISAKDPGQQHRPNRRPQHHQQRREDPAESSISPSRGLHELNSSTCAQMISSSRPGSRTLVVLVDESTKLEILGQFLEIIAPWRSNLSLTFGFVMLDKNLGWYQELLSLGLPETGQLLNLNLRHVVGTVLAITGYKRYFCIYHSRCRLGSKRTKVGESQRHKSSDFLGFDDDDHSSVEDENEVDDVGNTNGVAARMSDLPNWLEQLFDGSPTIKKIFVPHWPPMR